MCSIVLLGKCTVPSLQYVYVVTQQQLCAAGFAVNCSHVFFILHVCLWMACVAMLTHRFGMYSEVSAAVNRQ
jgi:hypothetical protein